MVCHKRSSAVTVMLAPPPCVHVSSHRCVHAVEDTATTHTRTAGDGDGGAHAVVTEVTAAQVFGRLADKKLLLDVPGGGAPEMKDCCHGGCDNCDYSRVFDEMNAGKAKWVACYARCTVYPAPRPVIASHRS